MKDSIIIGPEFFEGEKRNYSNWRSALIRELIQNSVDARSSRIDITLNKKENSTIIRVEDNGIGMTKDVLKNVFLSLGSTTKTAAGTIGGFGKAKILICFSQKNYKIQSNDFICKGIGAEYEITKSATTFHGCVFTIETDNSDWETIIKEFLNKCSLDQAVFINGNKYTERVRRAKYIRNLSFAEVFVNKSSKTPGVYIRVNGCWMFNKYSDIKAQVCVELNTETAREVLTANRDGLQYKQDDELQNFLNELSSDVNSALKDKTKHFTKFVNKGLGFKSSPKNTNTSGILTKEDFNLLEQLRDDKVNLNISNNQRIINAGANPIDQEFLPVYIQDPILSSMIIVNQSDDPKTIQLIKNFYMPEKWTNRAATRYQLIRIWYAICQIVMEELSNYLKQEYTWALGFNFHDTENGDDGETFALHMLSDGIHYLMFNPINKDRTLKYSVNDVDDYFNLVVLACHEATHCAFPRHDENFSSLFTILTQKVLGRRKEIVNNCKEAKNN